MKILAFTDLRYVRATNSLLAGHEARVMTTPPAFAWGVRPEWFSGYDVIYIDLHGQPGSVYLYSGPEARQAALNLESVKAMSLGGAVVFATCCYLPQTPFVEAFLDAGASAVIGGDGANYGGKTRLTGAQVLAQLVLRFMGRASGSRLEAARTALVRAKRALQGNLRLRLFEALETDDALAFRLFSRVNPAHTEAA